MKESNIRAQLLVLMAAVLWGTTGSAQAFAPNNANPMVIGALRMAIGGTVLVFMAGIKGSFKSEDKLDKKLLLIASLCMALYQPLFFSGVSKTGVALGTVLALGSAPVFSGCIEYFMGKNLSRRWVIATTLSIVGCVLLFGGQDSMDMNILGAILSLGAGLSYAVYASVSRKLFQNSQRELINGLVFFISAIILSPILFINDLSWVISTRGIITTLHLGIITTAIAYTLFAHGLVSISTPKAVTLTLAEPLTAAILGVLVFKEKLTFISMIGVLLLFLGLIINSYEGKEKSKKIINEEICN
ncbi:MAG: DMT family transporter [Anaeromicrobium sp.]|jgi:DME family drug/metabolite transporter|uniref:DMT family transporter n=1 Tax=Anaeromicrobium sp. TaxID=1929132 RepID=UPI0025D8FF43|nr:EamA family transporter [Anaeromicrobium sp.]MCT4594787.1 DMT family transporter [Anaeromicrobium sp.]